MLSSMVQKTIAMSEGSRVHVKAPSHCLSCKSSAALQLFKQSTALLPADCWLQKSVGQITDRNRAMSEGSRVHVKAPSHCLSCKSSATLQLFKQSTALLPADCWLQKSVGQITDRNRARLHSLFGMKFTRAQPREQPNQRSTSKRWSMGACEGPSHHQSCKSSTAL